MMKKLHLCILIICIAMYNMAFATNYVANASTDWNTATTWLPNGIPGAGDNVTIGSGKHVTLGVASEFVNNLTIGNGGQLTFTSTGLSLTITAGATVTLLGGGQIKDNNANNIVIAAGAGTCTFNNDGQIDAEGEINVGSTALFEGSGTVTTARLAFSTNGITLTINDTISYSATSGNACTISNSNVTVTGSGVLDESTEGSGSMNINADGITVNCIVKLGKDLTLYGGTYTFTIGSAANITMPKSIRIGPSVGGATNSIININSGAVVTTTAAAGSGNGNIIYDQVGGGASNGTTINNSGTVTITGDIILEDATGTAINNSGTWTLDGQDTHTSGTGTFTNLATGILNLDYSSTVPLSIMTLVCSAHGNVVNYTAAAAQTIIDPSTSKYYDLTLSGGGTKTLSAPETILGATVISATTTFASGNFNITEDSAWTNNGITFTAGTGTVTFAGSIAQTIGGSTSTTFNNLTINNSSAMTIGVSQGIATQVSSVFTLTKGAYNLSGYALTIQNSATTSISGGSSTAYVVSEDTSAFSCYPAPCATADPSTISWTGAATTAGRTYIFPFGATIGATNYYLPFTFKVTTGAAGNISLATYHTTVQNTPWGQSVSSMGLASAYCNAGVPEANSLVIDRGWYISAPSSPTGTITFTYAGVENTTTGPCGQTTANGISAERWNGAAWVIPAGANSVATGVTAGTGIATATGISTFSPWNLIVTNSPLPITLLDFSATYNTTENYTNILWSTATETNNKFFTVERSLDRSNFSEIATVPGAGNSNSIRNYSTIDPSPVAGIDYYRLKQTDFDGNYTYSDVVPVNVTSNGQFILFPNPVNSTLMLSYYVAAITNMNVSIVDVTGQQVATYSTTMQKGNSTFTADVSTLAAGVYFVRATVGEQTFVKKFIKQ